jgi:hypothetical protein
VQVLDAAGRLSHRAGSPHLRDFSDQVAGVRVEPPGWIPERLETVPSAG